MPISDCEKYAESDEINGLIKKNDLSINMKVGDDSKGFTIDKIYESDNDYCLKIDVTDTYSLRGETEIKPGDKYKLSFTLKNIDADPVIGYSFWKKPVTSLRHYTFKGENGNPPSEPLVDLIHQSDSQNKAPDSGRVDPDRLETVGLF